MNLSVYAREKDLTRDTLTYVYNKIYLFAEIENNKKFDTEIGEVEAKLYVKDWNLVIIPNTLTFIELFKLLSLEDLNVCVLDIKLNYNLLGYLITCSRDYIKSFINFKIKHDKKNEEELQEAMQKAFKSFPLNYI